MALESYERVAEPRRRPVLRAVAGRPLRIVDVSTFYGERSGGIRTYLDAKAAFAHQRGAFEHHLVVPGRGGRIGHYRHHLPSVPVVGSTGYRWPLGTRSLTATLRGLRPDVVLLHDPFWSPRAVTAVAQATGAKVVMVHHGSVDLDAHAWPGPTGLYKRAFRTWLRRAYGPVDAVMSACDPWADTGRHATLPLRFGLDAAFRPQPGVQRGDHVLYVGRLAREKGVFDLLEAAARAAAPWPLRLIGAGGAGGALAGAIRRRGLAGRVRVLPHITDRYELAAAYAQARCVVMPGPYETFGLVAFEAAASGASTVACTTAPSARRLGSLVHTFAPGDGRGLLAAIERARRAEPDLAAAADVAARHSWAAAFEAELDDLEALLRR
jgi:glycosyltransferase involved in cell wall biosynthesis